MRQISPEQARFLLEAIYLPNVNSEHRITTNVVSAIPEDKGGYRPEEVAKSAMELAWHIIATEMRFLDSIAAGEFDLSPRPKPESIQSVADLTRWYGENFQQRIEKLTAVSDEQLHKIVDFRGMLQLPAVIYLNLMLHHTVHHRGQLSVYLRPMGAKVPSIYGESYDSAKAKAAQQA